jgi:hypothetical protein
LLEARGTDSELSARVHDGRAFCMVHVGGFGDSKAGSPNLEVALQSRQPCSSDAFGRGSVEQRRTAPLRSPHEALTINSDSSISDVFKFLPSDSEGDTDSGMPPSSRRSDEEIGQKLVLATFRTLQEVAQWSRRNEEDGEYKIFHAHLTAYCAMIRGHFSQLGDETRDPNNLKRRICAHLESILAPSFEATQGTARRLHILVQRWVRMRSLPDEG